MLSGLKVLDLTRVLAGPLCTMLLGDLGADVIKVERPGTGDESRTWGPPFDAEGRSAYYLSINRNKLGLAADLNEESGRLDVEQLLADADVVVDNFLPGVLERRGLGSAQWCARRPELIWCTVTGFGPSSDRPGYDFVAQAESGWMAITGEPDGDPMKVGVALADVVAGKDATIAVLAALVRRGLTGEGARLTISLIDSARAALVNVAQNSLVTGHEARRWGNAHANLVPYQMFRTADRPIVIAVGSDAQWVAGARALGLDRFADDPSMSTNAGRLRQRARIVAGFAEQLATQPAAHWGGRLSRAGVPNGVVRTVLESLRDASASALTGVAPSVPGRVRYPPPALGEHSDIIRRFGWNVFKNVTAFRADGASS
jgi:crotonobetainyl-CoA:carnitine CoA-transferase CaiB-like acyl-CoA transferase